VSPHFLLAPPVLLNILPRLTTPPTPLPCVHPYSPPLLPIHLRSLPLLPARVVKLLCPVIPLAFRAQSLPTPHFSILAKPSSLSLPPVPPLSLDTPCQFFLNVDLSVVHTALRLIITPRRPTFHSSSCSTWLLCSYASTFSVYCFGAVLWKKTRRKIRYRELQLRSLTITCIAVVA
jgi:hypothetical protein